MASMGRSGAQADRRGELGFEAEALAGRRRAAQQHGRRRVQARRPRPDLPQVHLRRLRGEARRAASRSRREGADPEDPDEYRAANIFWVPQEARWSHLKASAPQPTIGTARRRRDGRHRARQPDAQGRAAQGLRPPRPRQAAPRPAHRPGQQHRPRRRGRAAPRTCSAASTSTSSRSSPAPRARRAASSTRRACVVRVLVEMLAPYKGRVYDPCCGSGGMFVQQREVHRGRTAARRRRHLHLRPGVATTPPGAWPR